MAYLEEYAGSSSCLCGFAVFSHFHTFLLSFSSIPIAETMVESIFRHSITVWCLIHRPLSQVCQRNIYMTHSDDGCTLQPRNVLVMCKFCNHISSAVNCPFSDTPLLRPISEVRWTQMKRKNSPVRCASVLSVLILITSSRRGIRWRLQFFNYDQEMFT